MWNFKEYFLGRRRPCRATEPPRQPTAAAGDLAQLAGAYVVNQAVLLLWYFLGYEYNYNLFLLAQGPDKGFNVWWEFWDPQGVLWYLSNLMMWRAAAPLWMELKRPLLASLLVVVCINYMPSEDYDDRLEFLKISSGVAFFPYYVLGIVCRRHSAKLHAALEWRATRPAALCALASCLALNFVNYGLQWSVFDFYAQCGGLCDDDNRYWFTQNEANWKASFRETYDGRALLWAWYDVVGGLPAHVAVLFGTLAAFSVRKEPVPYITRLGANSITNYFMHWCVLLALTCGILAAESLRRLPLDGLQPVEARGRRRAHRRAGAVLDVGHRLELAARAPHLHRARHARAARRPARTHRGDPRHARAGVI